MGRIFRIALKDVTIWTRDVAAMGILLGMPIVLILILGSALGGLGGDGGDLRVKAAVVNLDAGYTGPIPGAPPTSSQGMTHRMGDEVVEFFSTSDRLKELFDLTDLDDAEKAKLDVAEGRYAAALVIPQDFSKRVQNGEPAQLEVYVDPAQQTLGGILASVARSLAARYSAASVAVQTATAVARDVAPQAAMRPDLAGAIQGIAIETATADDALDAVKIKETQAAKGVTLRALDFYGLSMTSMFLMFGAMFGAFSTIKERREQTLSRLLSTPTSGMSVTAGKMLGVFLLGLLQFAVLYAFTRFAFGVQWGDNLPGIFAIGAAELLAVTGLAALIAALTTTERGAGGLGPLVIQVQALLGGAFFTISILPEWIQPIRYVSVVGWAMEGWSAIQMGTATTADIVRPVVVLVGIAALLFGFAAWRTGARR